MLYNIGLSLPIFLRPQYGTTYATDVATAIHTNPVTTTTSTVTTVTTSTFSTPAMPLPQPTFIDHLIHYILCLLLEHNTAQIMCYLSNCRNDLYPTQSQILIFIT